MLWRPRKSNLSGGTDISDESKALTMRAGYDFSSVYRWLGPDAPGESERKAAADAALAASAAPPFSVFPTDGLLRGLEAVCERLSGEFSCAVVLGMGGATLNPQALLS